MQTSREGVKNLKIFRTFLYVLSLFVIAIILGGDSIDIENLGHETGPRSGPNLVLGHWKLRHVSKLQTWLGHETVPGPECLLNRPPAPHEWRLAGREDTTARGNTHTPILNSGCVGIASHFGCVHTHRPHDTVPSLDGPREAGLFLENMSLSSAC